MTEAQIKAVCFWRVFRNMARTDWKHYRNWKAWDESGKGTADGNMRYYYKGKAQGYQLAWMNALRLAGIVG